MHASEQELKRSKLIVIGLIAFLSLILLFKFKAGLEYSSLEAEENQEFLGPSPDEVHKADQESLQAQVKTLQALNDKYSAGIDNAMDYVNQIKKENPSDPSGGSVNNPTNEPEQDNVETDKKTDESQDQNDDKNNAEKLKLTLDYVNKISAALENAKK